MSSVMLEIEGAYLNPLYKQALHTYESYTTAQPWP